MTLLRPLLDAEEAAWRGLCELFDAVPDGSWERAGVNGDWTPKDLMAHIAVWHAVTTDLFECMRSGSDLPPRPVTDDFNAEQVAHHRGLPLHDIQASSGASRHRFREELALLDDDVDDGLAGIIVANGTGHYAEHRPSLETFLKEDA